MTGRRRGFWWMLAGIVIAVAVGFCAWFARDLFLAPRVLKPGEGYEITPSQQVVASFEVPEQLVDQAVGLISNTVTYGLFPVISPAR